MRFANEYSVDPLFQHYGQVSLAATYTVPTAPTAPPPSVRFAQQSRVMGHSLGTCMAIDAVAQWNASEAAARRPIDELFSAQRSGPLISGAGPDDPEQQQQQQQPPSPPQSVTSEMTSSFGSHAEDAEPHDDDGPEVFGLSLRTILLLAFVAVAILTVGTRRTKKGDRSIV